VLSACAMPANRIILVREFLRRTALYDPGGNLGQTTLILSL